MIIEQEHYQINLIRKRVKNLNLRINAAGTITLSAPLKCPLHFIERFLQDKHEWIVFHQRRLEAKAFLPSLHYVTGETHYFLGQPYELLVQDAVSRQEVRLEGEQLNLFIDNQSSIKERQTLLSHWYREQFKELLPDLIKKWEVLIGVKVAYFGIKAMKTRWGSCNTREQRIWLNLQLIHRSIGCIEYVLVHEMVHLLEPSHNQRFYALMTQFLPNWNEYKKQLNNGLSRS